MKIDSFFGEYRFLSNFYPGEIEFEGIKYPTVEHAYQASKTLDENIRKCVASLPTPMDAKKSGSRSIELRSDWERVKFDIMKECVSKKFNIPELKEMLLNTGSAELIEGNTWGDKIWGVCEGQGQNLLGKILMEIRNDFN